MGRKQKVAIWALLGFVALGLYVVVPELHKTGWGYYRPGYWIGTFIGSGIAGAIVAGAISFFATRKSN